jgi:hypothetical protein
MFGAGLLTLPKRPTEGLPFLETVRSSPRPGPGEPRPTGGCFDTAFRGPRFVRHRQNHRRKPFVQNNLRITYRYSINRFVPVLDTATAGLDILRRFAIPYPSDSRWPAATCLSPVAKTAKWSSGLYRLNCTLYAGVFPDPWTKNLEVFLGSSSSLAGSGGGAWLSPIRHRRCGSAREQGLKCPQKDRRCSASRSGS